MPYLFFILLYPLTALILFETTEPGQGGGGVAEQGLTQFEIIMLILFAPLMLKCAVNLVIALFYPVITKRRTKNADKQPLPSVSVLIPAWNEEAGIAATIRSVLKADYPRIELIVINDGSTDATADRVQEVMQELALSPLKATRSIRFQTVPNGGKACAMNTALTMATGEIVVTIDSDSIMHREALRNIVRPFCDPKVGSVAGNVSVGNRNSILGLMQQLEYLCGFYFKRADGLMNAVYIVGGAAAAYRRDVVLRSGGFDESIITEDIELSTRLQDEGYKVGYAADATIFTEAPGDLRSLCQQRLRWKYGRLQTFMKYRHLFFNVQGGRNKFLCLFVLPVTLYCEMLLLFAPFLVVAFYSHAIMTGALTSLSIVIVAIAVIIAWQIAIDRRRRFHTNLVIVAPVAWLVFYVIDVVEYQALMRSLYRLSVRKGLAWQRWQRQGVFARVGNDRSALPSAR